MERKRLDQFQVKILKSNIWEAQTLTLSEIRQSLKHEFENGVRNERVWGEDIKSGKKRESQRYLHFWKYKEPTCKEGREKSVAKNTRQPGSIVSS